MRRPSPGIALFLASLACLRMAHAADSIELEILGIDGALRDNVLALSSLKRHAESQQLDQDVVERLVQRAPGETLTALRPFGYYEPQVGTELTRTADGWHARITIDPGRPVLLVEQQVEITGPGRDERFLRQALARSPLRTGARLSHPDYDLLKGELLRAAAGNGYLDATFTRAELIVDPAAHEARARVTLDTGERYRFGPTTIEQDFLKEGLVRRYLRYREGDWYDAAALLRTQFALDDSQYFAVVEVLPEERDRGNRIAPIRIVSARNKRYLYTIAAGYATDTRARGTLGWEDRRVNRSGHRMRAEIRGSSVEESIGLTYVVPWTDPALEKLAFELRGFREQRADVETEGGSLRVGLTQVRGKWQRVLFVTADTTSDKVTTTSGESTLIDRKQSNLLVPGISFSTLPPVPAWFLPKLQLTSAGVRLKLYSPPPASEATRREKPKLIRSAQAAKGAVCAQPGSGRRQTQTGVVARNAPSTRPTRATARPPAPKGAGAPATSLATARPISNASGGRQGRM